MTGALKKKNPTVHSEERHTVQGGERGGGGWGGGTGYDHRIPLFHDRQGFGRELGDFFFIIFFIEYARLRFTCYFIHLSSDGLSQEDKEGIQGLYPPSR